MLTDGCSSMPAESKNPLLPAQEGILIFAGRPDSYRDTTISE